MSEFWKGKNVLVTGIAGLIGSNIAERLLEEGANVVGLVRDVNSANSDIPIRYDNISLYVGNVTDYKLLREIIASKEVEYIFHLAAYSIVRVSAADPLNTYDINVMGTVALLEAARNVGKCKMIVVASSDKAYGDHDELPYVETHALLPRNTYDASKACADIIARTYANNYDMPVVTTRCSNVYGPRDSNLSRIVPNTIRRLYEGKRPVVYSDIENMEREFIFIDDVVDAYMLIAEQGVNPLTCTAGEAFNIGGNGPVKIRSLVNEICTVMGKDDSEVDIVSRDTAFREIRRQYINSDKMDRFFGWSPTTSLRDGLRETVEWYVKMFAEDK